jgi:glucuronyl/N-acetylglucosaminyl transferase EXT1
MQDARKQENKGISDQLGVASSRVQEYADLLANTTFALCPRGDALFSYRLLESMHAGVIPVILADGWVLPFSELLNYSDFALHVDESRYRELPQILAAIPKSTICAMRKRVSEVYNTHFASIAQQGETLLAILKHRRLL